MPARGATIAKCLASFDVDSASAFAACGNIEDEFKVIKKAYHRKILVAHPDKGGDAATFREVNASFEVLRGYFDKKKVDSSISTCRGDRSRDVSNRAIAAVWQQ